MLYHFVFFYFLIQIWFSYSFLIDSTGLTLAIFKIRNQIVSAVIIATDIKIPVQNQNPQLKNTVYICFHSCNTRYTNGKDRAAVTINKVIYKRANNQIICDIPAPFTLRIATSFSIEGNAGIYTQQGNDDTDDCEKQDSIFQHIFHSLYFI